MSSPAPINDHVPDKIFSSPNDGPTIASSTITAGTGKDPALSMLAKSWASSIVSNPPEISVLPPEIFWLITGAEKI